MSEHIEVAIVGGGQAGLATSRLLGERDIEHVIIDPGRVGDTWRGRWDSFHLVTPNWQLRLPGMPYDGPCPEGFASRDDVVSYLVRYANSFGPPMLAARVRTLELGDHRFRLDLGDRVLRAAHVVIATGTHQQPRVPAAAAGLSPAVTQLHASRYRNSAQLPPGGVLVVGSGQSGAQIAVDLHGAGRRVHLAVSGAGRLPRRYRGFDLLSWLDRAGCYDVPVERHPDGPQVRYRTHPHVTGRDGGQTIDLRQLAIRGVVLHGKVAAIEGTRVRFANDLEQHLDAADAAAATYVRLVDDYIARSGIAAPREALPVFSWRPREPVGTLDLAAAGISTVIWATGYTYAGSWIHAPVLDAHGRPAHERGVTRVPGLYFVGLHWQHTWGSGLFYSVGRDAAFIVERIAEQIRPARLAAGGRR